MTSEPVRPAGDEVENVEVDMDIVVEQYLGVRLDADRVEVLLATEEGNVVINFAADELGTRIYKLLLEPDETVSA